MAQALAVLYTTVTVVRLVARHAVVRSFRGFGARGTAEPRIALPSTLDSCRPGRAVVPFAARQPGTLRGGLEAGGGIEMTSGTHARTTIARAAILAVAACGAKIP